MFVSIPMTGRVSLTGAALMLIAAGCTSGGERAAARDTLAGVTTGAAATDTAQPSRTSGAPDSSVGQAETTTAVRSESAAAAQTPAPMPRVRPNIDPGRKTTTSPSRPKTLTRDTIASGDSATATDTAQRSASPDSGASQAGAGTAAGQDRYLKWDAGSKTATFELQAGPFNWNGFASGGATLTLPPNANVVMNFINKDGTPHSAEIISGEGPIPNQAVDAAIPRAYTNQLLQGLPQEGSDVMKFTVPGTGAYRIFCGVPGHGLSGMWIWMKVDPTAKVATFGATKG